ncbi:MAG: glycerophosphodiester phosphodiesterase [Alphaproteobacteria bacterium]|nr:glycerophosphodiester phosphodiesterase [Alphaproteobacteria bacterium]MCB9696783.1 glycerophosphodiester phosphodiesterase [Alphaproteobacteria bacterium]
MTRIIGHRGSPGHRPDHTLEGYRLAIEQGVDVIEPDLVPTKDGHLIARHENDLTQTTDVAAVFPERRTTRTVDGVEITGFFSEDLTLAEIGRLRAKQPMATRSPAYDGRFTIPTFDQILDLVEAHHRETGRLVGIEPETKHPTYFRQLGLPLEEKLLAALHARGLDDGRANVWIQSFESGNLKAIREKVRTKLLRLVDTDLATLSEEGMREVATFANGLGLHKSHLIGADGTPNDVLARAHALGLEVHVYTFRNEPDRMEPWAGGDAATEIRAFLKLGVDAIFADFPDTAVAVRDRS